MAFNLKSGNRPSFRKLGSNSYKSARKSSLKSSPVKSFSPTKQITEEEWNRQTNTGESGIPIEGGKGMEYLKADLASKGYDTRLANEIAMFGGKGSKITIAPTDEQLAIDPDKSISVIKNPTTEDIKNTRTARSENIIFNEPSVVDKEGSRIGYAHADYIKRGEGSNEGVNTNRLMPSSNIYFSDKFDWKGDQKNRIEGGDLIIHEGTHAITAGEHGMLPGTKDFLNKAKGGKGELAKPQEVYARYKVAQKFLKDKGIFDAFSGEKFTNEDVKEVEKMMEGVTANNYKQKGIPYEVFTFFGDNKEHPHGFNKKLSKKDMKIIFNNVASNEPDPGQITDDFGNQQTFA